MIINLSRVDFGGVAGGNAKPEEVFDVQPTTTDQTITPTEGSVFSGGTVRAVTKEIDVNIVSNNIKEGVTILGVAGTLKGEKPEEVFDVQPSTAEQTITPTEGSVFSSGTVRAVTSAIDSNILPENIKQGVSILGVEGTLSGGSIEDYIDFSTNQRFDKNGEFPLERGSDGKYAGYVYIDVPTTGSGTVEDYIDFSVTQIITKNGEFPLEMGSNGKYAGSIYVDIPATDVFVVPPEIRFGYSTFTEIPSNLDFSNITNMEFMFSGCSNLTTVSLIDLSNITDARYMFSDCSNLITTSPLNTSKVLKIEGIFQNCFNLTTVEGIDFSGLEYPLSYLFGYSSNMPNITRFIVNGKINVSISDDYSIKALTAIDYDSVKSILAAADRTDNTNAKTLAFNRTMTDQNGELAALVASCTSKGWTISGLTIQ